MYDSDINLSSVDIEDKKALCTGVTRVIAVLSQEQWQISLLSLISKPIGLIESLTKSADEINSKGGDLNSVSKILEKIADEILIIAIIVRTFNSATEKNAYNAPAALTILEKVWPYVNLLASTQSDTDFLFSSLSELLLVAVSISGETENLNVLQKIDDVMNKMIECVSQSSNQKALHPIMELVSGIIDTLGPLVNSDIKNDIKMSDETSKMREIVHQLTSRSLYLILALNVDSKVDLLPKMFSICTSGMQKCPNLFMTIPSRTDVLPEEKLVFCTITMACTSIDQKHVDVARAALLYLKEIVSYQVMRSFHL